MKSKPDRPSTLLPKLEVVLKCDSIGSLEAVTAAIAEITVPGVDIAVIHSSVGAVAKSDILLAETAGRVIIGFQVGVMPRLEKLLREHRVDVRLYDVIYSLTNDLKTLVEMLAPSTSDEQIIGSAQVIALFKSSRKGIIMGCEVRNGFLAIGQHFRVISAAGPVYSGVIESMHMADKSVQKAAPGQQVGIKTKDFNRARIGDIVESFRRPLPAGQQRWAPTGSIIRK